MRVSEYPAPTSLAQSEEEEEGEEGENKSFEIVNRGDSECASSYLRSDHPTERTRTSHKLHNTTNRHKLLLLLLLSEREREKKTDYSKYE